jgi:hypothetical protein
MGPATRKAAVIGHGQEKGRLSTEGKNQPAPSAEMARQIMP